MGDDKRIGKARRKKTISHPDKKQKRRCTWTLLTPAGAYDCKKAVVELIFTGSASVQYGYRLT